MVSGLVLQAQTTLSERKNDIKIPPETTSLFIDIKGGDGGSAYVHDHTFNRYCRASGGSGAQVKATFLVGTENNAIPAGSTLRFIKGELGETESFGAILAAGTAGGAGGGGSAVLYRKPGSTSDKDWVLLAAAGAGGGAYSGMTAGKCVDTHHGKGGSPTARGGDGKVQTSSDTEGGRNGDNGENFSSTSGGGAGYLSRPRNVTAEGAAAQKGDPAGGAGGHCPGCQSGGWGFGGGGFAFYGPGGGGGYSGGGAGSIGEAGGGGSFISGINTAFVIIPGIQGGANLNNGHVIYEFDPADDLVSDTKKGGKNIRFAFDSNKCITNQEGINANGNNVYLYDCEEGSAYAQAWLLDEERIQWASNDNQPRCLDVKDHETTNGTNVRLWDCMEHNEQRWIYDGITQQLRSFLNPKKCLNDAYGGRTDNETNILLWDCNAAGGKADQWRIEGVNIVQNPSSIKNIVPLKATKLALQSASAAHWGSNVQLWPNDGSGLVRWVFDGMQIKYGPSKDLCISLKDNSTSNGNNIELRGCAENSDAQKWIYDGRSKQLRSLANHNKCMEVKGGNFEQGSNIQIAACENVMRQKFSLKDM